MKIFPAIDIKDKKCVRLIKGDFDKKTEYEISPIDQAGKYKNHGFKNLHIVDLDGALTGKTVNLDIIQEIVSKHNLKIEIGGGVRSLDSIKQYIDAGVEKVIYYTAKNLSDKPTTGTAVFNVSPPKAGGVFMKVDCFCFVKQTLQPGEEVKMPVSFYVDPSINDDDNTKNLEEITLSYTFFKAET